MTPAGPGYRGDMADSLLQQQLDEVRTLLTRARELFGPNPVAPPEAITAPESPGAAHPGS